MMHRCCGNSHGGHVMGQCTCGIMYHNQTSSNFPMLFSMPNNHNPYDDDYGYGHDMYSSSSSSSSSSSVDCTLSLGTPSTRLTEHEEKRNRHDQRRWDSLQPKHNPQSQSKTTRGSSNGNTNNDSLLARRCANCDTTSTPLWRNGPRGPKSLCNACGIRFKKEERRASAAAAAATSTGVMESPNMYSHHNNSWYANSKSQKMSDELCFMDDANRDSENGIPNFLSWRLNVSDRTSLVHDFTI